MANANAVLIIILCTLMAYCLAQALVFGSTQTLTLAEAIHTLHTLSDLVFAAVTHTLHPPASPALPAAPPAEAGSLLVALLLTL